MSVMGTLTEFILQKTKPDIRKNPIFFLVLGFVVLKNIMNTDKPSYYAIIPSNVRYDKELTPNAKLLYGEITALCNKKGYCWSTNSYFAEVYQVSTVTISKWVNQLAKKGYITTEMIYKEGTKEIIKRYIRIVNDPIKENVNTPIKEKFKDNSTSINNTYNNTCIVKAEAFDVPSASNVETWESANRIANNLLNAICNYDATHRYNSNIPSLHSWARDIDLALRRDGRTEEQMNFIIDAVFVHSDKFPDLWNKWAINIESGASLRKQFDKIKNQIKLDENVKKHQNSINKRERAEQAIDRFNQRMH